MATYNYSQLEGLWIQAGGHKALAPLMAAIAEAESGGNSEAYNPSGASGLWQILGAPDNWVGSENWFDPSINARAAVAKYREQGLVAWATYTNGAYRQFLKGKVPPSVNTGKGNQPSPSSGGNSIIGDIENFLGLGTAVKAAGDIGGFFTEIVKLLDWIVNPVNWVRIVSGIAGFALLAVGIYMMGKSV